MDVEKIRKTSRRKKRMKSDIYKFLGLGSILLLALVFGFLISKPVITGAFVASGIEWENQAEVTADGSQQTITYHVIFGQYKPSICSDGIYIETSAQNIPFQTANEVYADGLCTETDVVFDNIIYNPANETLPENLIEAPVQENISLPAEGAPITAFAAAGIDEIKYDIYYGRITLQPELSEQDDNLPVSKFDEDVITILDWPMFHHDARHTGYVNVSGPKTSNLLWNFTTGGIIRSSPAIVDGVVYINSYDNNTYAINATNGSEIWNVSTSFASARYSVAVSNGLVYAAAPNSACAYNSTNGSAVWCYDISGPSASVKSSINVADGVVYFGGTGADYRLYAVDATSGNEIWSFAAADAFESAPAVADGVVYAATSESDDKLYAINATNGSEIWNYDNGPRYTNSVVVSGGLIYFGRSIYIIAVNITTGTNQWGFTMASQTFGTPAVAGGVVYAFSTNTSYAINATNGSEIWSRPLGVTFVSSPAVSANGIVYIGTNDTNVYALNASNGNIIWNYSTGGEISESSPALADIGGRSVLVIGSCDGKVYAFQLDTVTPLAEFVPPTETSGASLTRNSILVNVTASDAYLKNITLRLYNSTGLINLTTGFASPLFVNFTSLADGTYYFNATAYDFEGNFNNTETRTVTINMGAAVSQCSDLTASNQAYTLTQDLVGNMSDGICLHANASNITVNCANHHINGTSALDPGYASATFGIFIGTNVMNVTVRNCFVQNYSYGAYFVYSEGAALRSSQLYNNYYGIETQQTTNYSVIDNNTIFNNTYDGIFIYGAGGGDSSIGHNNITNNIIFNNSRYGIYLSGDNDCLLLNNIIRSNKIYDFYSAESMGNIFCVNNTFGLGNPTRASFTFPSGITISVSGVENPPADTADYLNISKYLNISSGLNNVYLNISYSEAELGIYNENSLVEQKYFTSWTWASSSLNTAQNYIYSVVNPASHRLYAPFINKNDYYSVYDCMDITTPGTYILKNDITNTNTLVCINITASNVVFDGSNFTIDGTSQPKSKAVLADTTANVTIKNATLTDWVYGVDIVSSQNSTVTNISASSISYGISAANSAGINITSNNLAGFDSYGIYIINNCNNIMVISNNASSPGSYGADIEDSNNIWVASNIFNGNSDGLDAYDCTNLTIVSNEFKNNEYYGIYLSGSYYSNVTSNTINNTQDYGIYVESSDNSTFISNTATNSGEYDIYLYDTSPGAVFSNQTITGQAAISFVWAGRIGINGTINRPADPGGYQNISKYVYAKNLSSGASLALNISYSNADLNGVDEGTLLMARHNGSWKTTTSVFANNYGVNTAANYVYANITGFSSGSIFAPLGTPGAPVTSYNLTVYIDSVQTDAFNYTGRPYLVDVKVTNASGTPQQNILVGIEEINGRNIFLPLLDSGYIYRGKAFALSNASGFVEFVIAPTKYAIQDIFNYSISAIVLDSSGNTIASRNLSIADISSLNKESKDFGSRQDTLKTRSENMLKIIANLKAWADLEKERRINITLYTNGTSDSAPQLFAGAIHRINITLVNNNTGLVVEGNLTPVELNGYLLNSIDAPSASSNTTNFAQGIKTAQVFYIVPSKYALTVYDKLKFNVTYGGNDVANIELPIYSDSLIPPSASDSTISNQTVVDNLKTHAENMLKVIANIKASVD